MIVQPGIYHYIDGLDHGYARVNHRNPDTDVKSWGIIDMKGNVVVPLEYDNIWDFYKKERQNTRMEKDGCVMWFDFRLGTISYSAPWKKHFPVRGQDDRDTTEDYGYHYGEFAGSYIQDVMEFSDDVINDAFEGDPDAYWNID